MVSAGVGSGRRRSLRIGAASLALHGALLWLVVVLLGKYAPLSRPTATLTSIEVVTVPSAPPLPPRPSPSPSPLASPGRPRPGARPAGAAGGVSARAHHEPALRAQPSASAVKSLADLKIHYEDPANFTDRQTAKGDAASSAGPSAIGAGLAGLEYGVGDSASNIDIPEPATASLARRAQPKRDYRNMRIAGASKFSGETIKLELMIDVHGRVHRVQLLRGVDPELDRKTIALVHTFEYEPALDDSGTPIPGTARWDIQIVDVEDLDSPAPGPNWR